MRISRRTTFLILIGILAAPATLGAKQIKPVYQTGHQIRAELGLSGGSGWMLVDLASGDVIDASNGDVAFVPASVAKLPTAAYALDALGPDHRFETTVRATGTVSNGRLDGDLVLRGGGDPELDTDGLWSLVAGLAEQGVRSVAGRFIVDASALPQLSEIESTQGVDASYNPSISGLNLNFNRVHLKWDARKGKREIAMVAASQQRSPEVSGVRTVIDADPTAPLFALSVSEGRETWRMAARAFRGQASRWLPVKNPASYAAEVFGLLARDRGIRLPAPTDNLAEVSLRQAGPASAEPPIARHESRKLGTILRDMLRFSTNVTAEVTGSAATRSIGISAVDLR
ncbi:MAG: D-alanyl-D-alanine carboxypeptidase/D-alanyl-D-alanine-endopeptidase, partial [Pseudomonadota bacterium]